jgi:hypothetical protein
VGTLYDYNVSNYNVWQTGKIGKDANLGEAFDKRPDDRPNDCKIKVPYNYIFELGNYDVKHTYTFWFNMWKQQVSDTNEPISDGTVVRFANTYAGDPNYKEAGYDKLWWELRIMGGKLCFYHANQCLQMETTDNLEDMGVLTNQWHHAAVVINRTAETRSKIYVDGLEEPVTIVKYNTNNADVATFGEPLQIGAGDRQFDGCLDELELYTGELSPLQVCILYQLDGTVNPIALNPFPRSSNVIIGTGLLWNPVSTATRQTLYFDKDADVRTSPLYTINGDGNDMNSVANGAIGGPLTLNTTYYWAVDTNVNNNMTYGPVWSFTTETGKAMNPSPADGTEDVNDHNVPLSWTTPTAVRYDVYFSDFKSKVDANDPNVRRSQNIAENNIPDINSLLTLTRGTTYYWRVDSNYPYLSGDVMVTGDVWTFRTKPYELIFNTKNGPARYADHDFNALECALHSLGWTHVATGSLDSNCGTAGNPLDSNGGIAVFDFNDVNGFNYDHRYDIVVIPAYQYKDIIGGDDYTASGHDANVPTPLAIHVNGNFYFDGRINLSGDDVVTTEHPRACSGGFPGPKQNSSTSPAPVATFWTDSCSVPAGSYTRFGIMLSAKTAYSPTAYGQTVYGPGVPVNPPYKPGGGGGYGGIGGGSGRGYWTGIFSGGPSYGDKEVPVPFGGSAGCWGAAPDGAAGGGGIEIVATGNVVLDINSEITSNGGNQLFTPTDYAGGGGAGGSVKIIADGNVIIKGNISVNGGVGGDSSGQANEEDAGGGGAGGRIAIFYGPNYTLSGQMTANGGSKGTDSVDHSLAQNGQNGTIFSSNGSPRKASAPTPKNGENMVYAPTSPTSLTLKWYSGYNVTSANDIVYFGTNTSLNDTNKVGEVNAVRGQHSVSVNVYPNKTYYWKVKTKVAPPDNNVVDSNAWSFSTVGWRCPIVDINDPNNYNKHIAGPRWDTNGDCVEDDQDFAYFAKDWHNSEFGTYTLDEYNNGGYPGEFDTYAWDLARFASEWLDCYGRTNDGCNGW